MTERLVWRWGIIGMLLLLLLALVFEEGKNNLSASVVGAKENTLSVTFLDIGQGDSILIETPDGVQVLIDGGADGTVLRELARELSWGDRTLDLVVGTHPDKDHIGGLVEVLAQYEVGHILTTENRGETMVATSYQEALLDEGVPVDFVRAGDMYRLGASTTLAIYSPATDPTFLESNTSSIVAKLSYGEIDFMLTGDAPLNIEDYLVATYGAELESEVLKLGHHGSKTSSGENFLKAVSPEYAVVSAGKDNSYGHPHQEVVDRVVSNGINLLSTQTDGAITFVTDGETLWEK